jgi:DNA end-binding protein Ku
LRYGDEVRDASGFEFPGDEVKLKADELKMAQQLIDSMRGHWDPAAYRDTYRDEVMARIEAKIDSGETHAVPTEGEAEGPRSAEVIDLMSLLKKSIPAARNAEPEAAPSKPKTASGKAGTAKAKASPARKRA